MKAGGIRNASRRNALQALGAGSAGVLLGIPSKAIFAQVREKLAIGFLPFPNWCQLAAASHFGWFKAEGVKAEMLDIKYFDSGPPQIEAAIGGNLQLMGLGAGPVINALATGALPLRILAAVGEVSLLFGLVVQKGIERVTDLRGKKIAVTIGTNYQYFLESALADFGMTAQDVTLVDSQPNEGTIAFLAGRVDATVPDYSDTKLIPRRREGAKVIVTGGDIGKLKGPPFRIFDLWVAPQKAFEANKEVISSVIRAANRWGDFLAGPETHAAAIDFSAAWSAKISGKALTRGDVEATMEGAHYFSAAGQKQLASEGALAMALGQHAEFLVRHGKLKKVPDFEAAVDKSIW
jgi:ABC-type nitrate/sulfonate/bicarbonate transport system substrate-binding protein